MRTYELEITNVYAKREMIRPLNQSCYSDSVGKSDQKKSVCEHTNGGVIQIDGIEM